MTNSGNNNEGAYVASLFRPLAANFSAFSSDFFMLVLGLCENEVPIVALDTRSDGWGLLEGIIWIRSTRYYQRRLYGDKSF